MRHQVGSKYHSLCTTEENNVSNRRSKTDLDHLEAPLEPWNSVQFPDLPAEVPNNNSMMALLPGWLESCEWRKRKPIHLENIMKTSELSMNLKKEQNMVFHPCPVVKSILKIADSYIIYSYSRTIYTIYATHPHSLKWVISQGTVGSLSPYPTPPL